MTPTFTSNVPLSMPLWGPEPSNWDKMGQEAKDCYSTSYKLAFLAGCTHKDCHSNAMKEMKKSHKLKGGQWVPKTE